MGTTNEFKRIIQEHLELKAFENPEFKDRMQLKDKNIEDCVKYILNTVKKSGCNGFADSEVFAMAENYYTQDKVDIGEKINAKVVVNHKTEKPTEKTPKVSRPKKSKPKMDVVKNQGEQISLF